MSTVPPHGDKAPQRQSPDRTTRHNDATYVSLDELFDVAAEPALASLPVGVVLEPACRRLRQGYRHGRSEHPGWDLLRQVFLGGWAHAGPSALLLGVIGVAVCGILLASSVALTAAGAALAALLGLLQWKRWHADKIRCS
ncbi:hypothetical protein GCM10023192_34700 [Amycolatopsis samaneae]